MKTQYTLIYNPKCSKSREALTLLESHNIQPVIRDYLTHPLSQEELRNLLQLLNIPSKNLVRTKEEEFQNIEVDLENSESVLKVLAQHPRLLERPILMTESHAVIARPPAENIEILLKKANQP